MPYKKIELLDAHKASVPHHNIHIQYNESLYEIDPSSQL